MGSRTIIGKLIFAAILLFFGFDQVSGEPLSVHHDGRALLINGERKIIFSGSIHYPRSTPEMWPDLINKAKEGGLDAIETYMFWNVHEPRRREYNFEGRFDFVKFLKTVQQAGLYAVLRIGPYVCAEWNFGALPVWLHDIPGIELRTDNDMFKFEMETFTKLIVSMIKKEGLLASQGGPLILVQIENEYGNIMGSYGEPGKKYINWAAKMAESLNVSIPWIMCQQDDAPKPMINTCNGFYCDQFEPNSPNSPKMWTENWTGWFKSYGGSNPHRPVEDIAYAVARFIQTGGTFQNYYMYHGGTNFGRTAGGPFITTTYDYDAPIDEYGYVRQPKWGHLKELHESIKQMEKALTYGTRSNITLGPQLEATIYTTQDSAGCFLSNTNSSLDATVSFNGSEYHLPAWSVSVLPDCKTSVFNTAKVNTQTSLVTMKPEKKNKCAPQNWQWHQEGIHMNFKSNKMFPAQKLLEQISTTVDATDYLWYTTRFHVSDKDPFWSQNEIILQVTTSGHAIHAFLNGEQTGFNYGHGTFVFEQSITPKSGWNTLTLLSVTVGLQNYGAFYDLYPAGINTGPVSLVGNKNITLDLSSNIWMYKIGLTGEEKIISQTTGGKHFKWNFGNAPPSNSPLIWYKAEFEAPEGNEAVVLDLGSMGKGQAWVNGESIGRYWPQYTAPTNECEAPCDYRGPYSPSRCVTDCNKPTQRWYHVPRSWLHEGTNSLILFEELGGEPSGISVQTVHVETICSHSANEKSSTAQPRELHLQCPHGKHINSISFASFGDPQGSCGSYQIGTCHAPNSFNAVNNACVGRESCTLAVSEETFGNECGAKALSLAVQATCST